jgi:sodium-dependent dicarboxylate transporter 2/3/5
MKHWKRILLWLSLIAFTITLICSHNLLHTESDKIFCNAVAMGGLMVVLWISEAIPIYLTALIPLIAGVPLGILSPKDLAESYGDRMVYLFFGGFIMALALEKWKIHIVVANAIIRFVGNSKPRILFGFLMSTGLISMWVSNTSTALMMLPMALAIVQMLPEEERSGRFAMYILLSVAYGANIGGMGTLVGSPPNLQMAQLLSANYHTTVGFVEWLTVGMPVAIVMLLGAYLFFYLALGDERKQKVPYFHVEKTRFSQDQWKIILIFLSVVALWICRDYISGKNGFFPRFKLTDEASAILGALLLFILPTKDSTQSERRTLLSWKDTEQIPWGILLMFGGGLALASAMEYGGVVNSLATLIKGLENVTVLALMIIIVVVAVFGTELLSNLTMVTLFVPIIATFAKAQGFGLLELCIPLTLASSCGFMMPVGTPPNAIVYASGRLTIHQMMRAGFVVNVIGMIVIVVLCSLLL